MFSGPKPNSLSFDQTKYSWSSQVVYFLAFCIMCEHKKGVYFYFLFLLIKNLLKFPTLSSELICDFFKH